MMNKRRGLRKSSIFLCLFMFLFVTAAIQFCHTERTFGLNYQCPACHLLVSSISTSIVAVFVLPSLIRLETLSVSDVLPDESPLPEDLLSRGPPQA